MRPPFEPASERDIAVVSAQLGRPARDVLGIPARCVCGNPTVVATAPRLADGTPFPTLYYLTHPAATAAMSQLEATQVMAEFNQLSAGGMPTRVKCLHALAGHSLAVGPGINPIGDLALERSSWKPTVCACLDYGV